LYTGESCIRRNDILCKEFSSPLNIEWIQNNFTVEEIFDGF